MGRPLKFICFPLNGIKLMLQWAFPKMRPEERERFYRLYLRDNIHAGVYNWKASIEEIEAQLKMDADKPFGENEAYTIQFRMAQGLAQWRREILKQRASKGGIAKSKKLKKGT